jgi:hypothetical protein
MFHNIFSDDNLAFTAIHESDSRKETREKRRRKLVICPQRGNVTTVMEEFLLIFFANVIKNSWSFIR